MKTKIKILTWIGILVLVTLAVFAIFITLDLGKPREKAHPPKLAPQAQGPRKAEEQRRKELAGKERLAEEQRRKDLAENERIAEEQGRKDREVPQAQKAPQAQGPRKAEEARKAEEVPASMGPAEEAPPVKEAITSFLLIDRILDSLPLGAIAFNAPSSMNLKDIAQIQLLLSLEQSIEELSNMVTAAGEKEGASIRISNQMEARLSGANFQITAITPEEQAIASKGNTEWKWEVKPTSPGTQYLHLTLTAIFNVDNRSTRRAIRTYDKTIEVEVTWGQKVSAFIGDNWKWLWATLLFPLAGFLWKICKRRVAKNRDTPQKSDDEQSKGT